jgi:hypothetical protein
MHATQRLAEERIDGSDPARGRAERLDYRILRRQGE